MRATKVLVLLLALGAAPLGAQLTPAQRQEREILDLHRDYARLRADWMEQRAMAGDASAYGGPAAWGNRRYWAADGRWNYLYAEMRAPMGAPMGAPIHWAALSQAPERANALKPLTTARLRAKAGSPTFLTLASPIGGPERTLMIRTAVAAPDGQESWARMGEITADAEGRFVIPLPMLDPGNYTLEVQVYDRDKPAAPYSSSKNSLRVE